MSRRPNRTGRPARQARARQLNLEALEGRELLSLPPVTTTADNGNNSSPIPGSLRAVIVALNNDTSNVGADSISFDIASSGVQTISLVSTLPTITHRVVIDGTTEPGYNSATGAPVIVLDGSSAGVGANGLVINTTASGSTVRGLSIVGFTTNSTSGGGEGIYLNGTAGGNVIVDDYIGVEPDGSTAKANSNGILAASPNNTIGGSTTLTSDVISGNANAGVILAGASATGNLVTGNIIGLNAAGSTALGNQYGVLVMASNNTIGGTGTGAGNVLSGNVGPQAETGAGILFEGTATSDLVEGNQIGTNAAGTTAIVPGNYSPAINYSNVYGIFFGTPNNSAADNFSEETIGGSVAGAGNLISGNVAGITGSSDVTSSSIEGNILGLNLAGTSTISNGQGITLGASLTTIGGTTALARNVISGGNTVVGAGSDGAVADGSGLTLSGDSDLVEANFVGTGSSGLAIGGSGNVVGMNLDLTNSTIGGLTIGLGNVVSGNSGDGIDLLGVAGTSTVAASNNQEDALYGNVIGLDIQGNVDANAGNGIALTVVTPTPTSTTPLALGDTIGATTSGAGNIIAHEGGAGIVVDDQNSTGISGLGIRGNTIFANAHLGIDTQDTGVPVPSTLFLNSDTVANGAVTLTGVYFDAPGTIVSIDLFANAADPSGYGQGPVFLGTVAATTNASGFATFSATYTDQAFTSFSATDTPNSTGNTSEFAANFPTVTGASVANLVLTPTTTSSTVTVGDSVTFIETITNDGPNAANGVVFYDTLPGSLVNPVIMTSQGSGTVGVGNLAAASLGTLAAGASASVVIIGATSVTGALVDQPGVSSTTYDPNYINNFATQTLTVNAASTGPSADLAVLQSASSTTAQIGAPLTFTVSVGNIGPDIAESAMLYDTLPAGTSFVGFTTTQGTPSIVGNLVTVNLGAMAPGAVATITFIVAPTASGTIVNLATVSNAAPEYDSNPANNSAGLAITVAPSIHFYLAEVPFPTTNAVGQFQAFTLYVENFGPSTATNVYLIDNLPTGSTYYSSTPSQGVSTLSNGQVIVNFGTLAAGAVASLQLIVIPTAVGALTNVAGVYTPDVPSVTPAFATATTSIVAGPSVSAINGMGNNALIAITFNEAISQVTATNPANYQLVAEGKTGTGPAKTIAIAAIAYNAITHTVTILPAQAIDPTQYYKLTVVGATTAGITDTLGRKLASTLYGTPGSNFSVTFFAGTLPQV